jgi:hypothetical protein
MLRDVPEWVLEPKRRIGTAVHKACELDDLGVLDEDSVHASIWPYLCAWREFKMALRPTFILIEQPMYHPDGYAGTPDRVALIDEVDWLLDLKTTLMVEPRCHGAQLAGYNRMKLCRCTRRAVVKLGLNGRFKLVPLESPQHEIDFLNCWDAYKEAA